MDITSLCRGTQEHQKRPEELRISEGSTEQIKLFTKEGAQVTLHYGADESLRGFYHCLGDKCPSCRAGQKRTDNVLLPVVSVTRNAVVVLRMTTSFTPTSILPLLAPHLEDLEIAKKVVQLSRTGKFEYSVRVLEGAHLEHVGKSAVEKFLQLGGDLEASIKGIYPTYTEATLKHVPTIRRALEIIDGPGDGEELI